MEISEDTKNVVNTLNQFIDNKLRKKNDLEVVMEIAVSKNMIEEFSQAIFNAKAFWNLSKTLNKVDPDDDDSQNFKREFERYLEMYKQNLKDIIKSVEDDETNERFNETYFEMNRGCVLNLIDLAHDLGRFKDMQGEHKRNKT